jgi:hypothetical protein
MHAHPYLPRLKLIRLIPTWQKDGKQRGAILEVSSVTVIENYPKP